MRKIRLAVVIAAALGLNVTGATLWFRPVDGYGGNNPANWLTGAGTAVNRLPQTDDAVLLSSSRIQADTPLVVPGGVTALCQRLTVGEIYNNGSHPVVCIARLYGDIWPHDGHAPQLCPPQERGREGNPARLGNGQSDTGSDTCAHGEQRYGDR